MKGPESGKIIIASFFLLLTFFLSAHGTAGEKATVMKKRVVLLGASVGKDWNLAEFPSRVKSDNFVFESVAVYQYDKTEALEEVLMRPRRKFKFTKSYVEGLFAPSPEPADIIILKECAAYFPGDLDSYERMMDRWVRMIKEAGKEPIVATVVPVTESHARGRKGRLESILKFNDWVREYAKKENIRLLDLEAALRKDGQTRFLRDELTSGDGLHINKRAYGILDMVLKDTCRVN